MNKLNETGAVGVWEALLIGVLVLVVGVAGFRISQVSSDIDDSANKTVQVSENSSAELIEVAKTEDDAKKVEVPSDEDKKKVEPEEDKEVEKVVEKEDPKDEVKEEKTYQSIDVSITAVTQDATNVYIEAAIDSVRTGDCYGKIKKDGQDKIYTETEIQSKKACTLTIKKSDIPVDGEWVAYMWFYNHNHTAKGWSNTQTVNVTL